MVVNNSDLKFIIWIYFTILMYGEYFYLFDYGIECGLRLMGWQIFYYIF